MGILLLGACSSNASADWTASTSFSPLLAYTAEHVTYTISIKNTGPDELRILWASLDIDWGSTTTNENMFGDLEVSPGRTGHRSCGFDVPDVSPGVYEVFVTVEGIAEGDLQGTTTTYKGYLTIKDYQPLSLDVQASVSEGQAPLTVHFASTTYGGERPYTYLWTFGDGITSNQSNPIHQYAKGGEYAARCSITDSRGLHAEDEVMVTVEANPMDITDLSDGPSIILSIVVGAITSTVVIVGLLLVRRRKQPKI